MSIKRYEMTDDQWEQISYLLLGPKTGRPQKNNRLMFNAILWIARSGAGWRDLRTLWFLENNIQLVLQMAG
jgi:transposase